MNAQDLSCNILEINFSSGIQKKCESGGEQEAVGEVKVPKDLRRGQHKTHICA